MLRAKIHDFWKSGSLYCALALSAYVAWAFTDHVGIWDWRKEIAYLDYIHSAIGDHRCFPWFWWSPPANVVWYPAINHSFDFVGNPETMLFSPLIALLLIIDVSHFIKLAAITHCIAGIVGAYLLKRRLGWSAHQFRWFAALFLLSPIIWQHLAIGYMPWLTLFLFPLLIYSVATPNIKNAFGTAAVLSLTLLEGGSHVSSWFIALLVLWALMDVFINHDWRRAVQVTVALVATVALALPRLIATSRSYSDFRQPIQTSLFGRESSVSG